jgi:hypothetical protein
MRAHRAESGEKHVRRASASAACVKGAIDRHSPLAALVWIRPPARAT